VFKQHYLVVTTKLDDFVKSPSASLRGILRHCAARKSTAGGTPVLRICAPRIWSFLQSHPILTFYETIKLESDFSLNHEGHEKCEGSSSNLWIYSP